MGNCFKKSFLYTGSVELLEPLVTQNEEYLADNFVSKHEFNMMNNKMNREITILKSQLLKLEQNTHDNLKLLSEDIHFINNSNNDTNTSTTYINSHIMDNIEDNNVIENNNIEDNNVIENNIEENNIVENKGYKTQSKSNTTTFVQREPLFNYNETHNSHYLYNNGDDKFINSRHELLYTLDVDVDDDVDE